MALGDICGFESAREISFASHMSFSLPGPRKLLNCNSLQKKWKNIVGVVFWGDCLTIFVIIFGLTKRPFRDYFVYFSRLLEGKSKT